MLVDNFKRMNKLCVAMRVKNNSVSRVHLLVWIEKLRETLHQIFTDKI